MTWLLPPKMPRRELFLWEFMILQRGEKRFGEMLRLVQDRLNSRNYYAFNPAFDVLRRDKDGSGACNGNGESVRSAASHPILDSDTQVSRTTTQTASQTTTYTVNGGCTAICPRYTVG